MSLSKPYLMINGLDPGEAAVNHFLNLILLYDQHPHRSPAALSQYFLRQPLHVLQNYHSHLKDILYLLELAISTRNTQDLLDVFQNQAQLPP